MQPALGTPSISQPAQKGAEPEPHTEGTLPWGTAGLETQAGGAEEEKRRPDIARTGRKPAAPAQREKQLVRIEGSLGG